MNFDKNRTTFHRHWSLSTALSHEELYWLPSNISKKGFPVSHTPVFLSSTLPPTLYFHPLPSLLGCCVGPLLISEPTNTVIQSHDSFPPFELNYPAEMITRRKNTFNAKKKMSRIKKKNIFFYSRRSPFIYK